MRIRHRPQRRVLVAGHINSVIRKRGSERERNRHLSG
jgi:hypothetical protein